MFGFGKKNIKKPEKVSKNIVFIDSSPNESKFDSVMFDLNASVREILSTLIDRGYKKIGYIGGVEEISLTVKLGRKRELIFRDYLFQKNMLESKYIHIGSMTSESGYKLMKKILEKSEKAEVYVCSNDSIALGALRAINEAGLNVPKDIGIIGFNNEDMSEYTFPPLTSVDVNGQFIGEQALISLLERIEGRNIPIKKIIPTKIIFRQSIK